MKLLTTIYCRTVPTYTVLHNIFCFLVNLITILLAKIFFKNAQNDFLGGARF